MASEDWIALLKHMGTAAFFFTLVWNVRVKKPSQRLPEAASNWQLCAILLLSLSVTAFGLPIFFKLSDVEQLMLGVLLLGSSFVALRSVIQLANYWLEWRKD